MKRTRLSRKTAIRKRSPKRAKVESLDELWSKVVRTRAGWKCIIPGCMKPTQGCHIFPKGKYTALRHDPENGFGACYNHHINGWHKDPMVQKQIIEILEATRGPNFMERMSLRARTATRPDKAAIRVALQLESKSTWSTDH